MTTEEFKARRAAVLEITKDLRNDYGVTQDKLRKVAEEMSKITYPCARLTRLGDLHWDLSARLSTTRRIMDKKVSEYIATQAAA